MSQRQRESYIGGVPLFRPDVDVIEELVVLLCGGSCQTGVGWVFGVDKRERDGGRELLVAEVQQVVDAASRPVKTEKRYVVVKREAGMRSPRLRNSDELISECTVHGALAFTVGALRREAAAARQRCRPTKVPGGPCR